MKQPLFMLSSRLELCAKYVRSGCKVVDIGTDHAYLPIYLAVNGKAKSVIASDLRESPLERGKQNICRYGVEDIVSVRLSDGLKNIENFEADDIIIAGMGGELIAKIISETPWLKNTEKHLILQPMSRAEVLREYLFDNGFEILTEECVISEKRIYTVMLAVYCDRALSYNSKEKYLGRLKKSDNEHLYKLYKEKVMSHLNNKLEGKKISGDIQGLNELEKIIFEIGE